MRARLRSLLSSFWLKLVLSAALLALLAYGTDMSELRRAILEADLGWLAAAVAVYVGSQVLSALRWCLLARPLGFEDPASRFITYYFSGMFMNLFVPGTVAGDIGRGLFLAGGRRRAAALTTVLAHRAIGFIALVWLGAAAIAVQPGYPLPRLIYWAAWLAPPATVIGWLWGPLLAVRLLPAGHRWRRFVERDLDPYWKDTRLLAVSMVLALIFHAAQVWSQLLIASALGLSIPWGFFFIFVPIVNIAGMIPMSLSGIGVREAGYWYFLSMAGVGREAAMALGLLSSAIVLGTGLSGAPAFLSVRPQRTQGESRRRAASTLAD